MRSVYDALHRRTDLWVEEGEDPVVLAEQTIYGDGQTDPEDSNLRGSERCKRLPGSPGLKSFAWIVDQTTQCYGIVCV